MLLTHGGDDALNERNGKGVVWDAFVGGRDTQVTGTAWVLGHLVQNPNLKQKTAIGNRHRGWEGSTEGDRV